MILIKLNFKYMSPQKNILDIISQKDFNKIKNFSKDKKTPLLIIDKKKIEKNYDELQKNLPYARIYYAVKANPNDEVIKILDKKGSNFDIATIYEMEQLIRLGISTDRMSFGNTIKKEADIAYAYNQGIRLFATDSESDLNKLRRQAPGSKVFFRLLCDGTGADWPLSRKFGAYPDMIFRLALKAKKLNLIPYGLSFHVGSQQRDIGQWDNAISQCKYLFDSLSDADIELKLINIGGGFPSNYLEPTQNISVYAKEVTRFLKEDFGKGLPEIIIEPGRSLVADSGVLVTEIIMISSKSATTNYDWVYTDVGKFGGLIETIDEAIKYPILSNELNFKDNTKEVILAGPTCDSMDILYENYKYKLNKNIKEGDRLYFLTTGAYTASYSSVYFNGFPPLQVYVI